MNAVSTLLDLLYPRRCAGCGASMRADVGHLCWECMRLTPLINGPICDLCGNPGAGHELYAYHCSSCSRRRPAFDKARSAARYGDPLKNLLLGLKYRKECHLAADLALFLEACVKTHYKDAIFDVVAYVPLHCKRKKEREYNQSLLLAVQLARRLNLPVFGSGVVRVKATRTQTNLSARERRENVRGAFEVRNADWVEGRRFLLVDDVMTTGATVNECSRVLKSAGAADVCVVTVARG